MFPESFIWGSAASSTQTEGAAPRADWFRWEAGGHAPPSRDGNGFTTNYADDFALFQSHGLTHHRLSIEWARIEPAEGKRDSDAIDRYTDMLRTARDAGIAVWVCLHHFTLPGWFSEDMRGFLDERGRSYYWARHVDFMGETFGDLVFGWKPINEPIAFAAGGWLLGWFPPGKIDPPLFFEALEATHLANHEAWRLLRSGGKPIATVQALSPLLRADDSPATRASYELFDQGMWGCWIGALRDGILQVPNRAPIENEEFAESFDLVGFSYYGARMIHGDRGPTTYPADRPRGPLGDAHFPEGLRLTLDRLADELPGRPLLVAECGLGTDASNPEEDEARAGYLDECLRQTEAAIDDGTDVRGFFHWTAVDNYEWLLGYDAQFGLFDRDRRPKASAEVARRWAAGSQPQAAPR